MPSIKKLLQAAAGNAGGDNLYVEGVFSTYLYTGNGSTQTITNGIDLAGEGGLVWMKNRDSASRHSLFDTERNLGLSLATNLTNANISTTNELTAFNSNGFNVGASSYVNELNKKIVFWTFRKAEKFFDVVTYTGTGVNRTVAHDLGAVPGMIIVKRTDTTGNWQVYHRSLANTEYMVLNSTAAKATGATRWNSTTPTSTVFSLGTDSTVNASGGTYVAYLYAHDAGGFGDDGSESIIKCGSYTGADTTQEINLGFEPQWVLIKSTGATSEPWALFDVMRGMPVGGVTQYLKPNTSEAETNGGVEYISPTPTGFKLVSGSTLTNSSYDTGNYIYIAIRRPMKTPESGTEVFTPNTIASSVPDGTQIDSGFAIDMNMTALRGGSGVNFLVHDRLRGVSTTTTNGGLYLETSATQAEDTGFSRYFNNTGFQLPSTLAGSDLISYSFKRGTGFFDVVAYTGSASVYQKPHNLGVVPELMIVKNRGANETGWSVYTATTGADNRLQLNSTGASSATSDWDNASDVGVAPTATHFNVKAASVIVNSASYSYIAYLFATLAGVSKVGSYTGTGTTQTINCGFTAGSRFVMIKRTDSTGDWYVWDSARGISAGNDPYLLLNSTAAEVTNTDYIDPLSSGFTVTSSAPAALNASGGTYIFMAIS